MYELKIVYPNCNSGFHATDTLLESLELLKIQIKKCPHDFCTDGIVKEVSIKYISEPTPPQDGWGRTIDIRGIGEER
jgi:hypothetical protein